jgi:hypothetical protein
MGFKHLVGYCLLMAGMGMMPLFFAFLPDSKFFNPLFLLCLGVGALAFFFLGFFVLRKCR